jgi:hypothetical protein
LERKLTKISTILFPKSVYDFDNLEAEIKRLKIKEIVPELPIKKRQLSDLISKCKIQLSSDLKPFFDLYLRSLSAKEEDPIKKIKLETKLEVYEEILSTKVNESDLIQSKKLQLEVNDLQEHLDNLQFSESELQIQILPK